MLLFNDRAHAGQLLAQELQSFEKQKDTLILALPRGGVPVAFEIAKGLKVPLDVFLVRKLGVPGHKELAMGAIALGGVRVFNEDIIKSMGISDTDIERVTALETQELERRNKRYRGRRSIPKIKGQTILLIDDGIATGATMRAAIKALRVLAPKEIIVAVPVAAISSREEFEGLVEGFYCLETPTPFYAIGAWYRDFEQMEDEEVIELLSR